MAQSSGASTGSMPPDRPRVGDPLTLNIVDIAFGGEGVARHHDLVIFVPWVIPGEQVEAEIVEVKKQFARARLIRILKSSPDRAAPRCPYFGTCGGCQYQHLNYSAQLALKHKQITDLFQRIGGFAGTEVDPVVPCPQPYGYRNRIMVRSQWDRLIQGLRIGFLQAESRLVVDIEACQIAEPELNEQLREVRAHPPARGGLKVLLRKTPPDWQVPKDSFFQNNFHLLPQLAEVVRGRLQDSNVRFLIDAYCGVGFFSIETASLVQQFIGVEVDRMAIQAARENARNRGVANGEYLMGRTEVELPALLQRFPARQTAVVLDPPRTGCARDILEMLRLVQPEQIIYVSCHPATLARDAKVLSAGAVYTLSKVTPLDMFPQTQHVECVADFRRSSSIK